MVYINHVVFRFGKPNALERCSGQIHHSLFTILNLFAFLPRQAIVLEITMGTLFQSRIHHANALLTIAAALCFYLFSFTPSTSADEYDDAIAWNREGKYEKSLNVCEGQLEDTNAFNEKWYLLGIENAMRLGRYERAFEILQDGLEDRRVSGIKLYPAGHRVALFNNEADLAQEYLDRSAPYINSIRYSRVNPENLAYLGDAALKLEVDPRVVLELFFDPGMKATPPNRESFLAAADLALKKEDYAVAENTVKQGLQHFPDDAELLFRWAQALAGSGNNQMGEMLTKTLEANPNHVGAMLMFVDNSIDAEDYDQARELLEQVKVINPRHPDAWAYEAVIAHLHSDYEKEKEARDKAMSIWTQNPEVDHLIGRKLSQKYRFAEGADYQKASLKLKPDYSHARIQLAQDLLRLGHEHDGWQMAEDMHDADGYNVTAFNLMQLKSVIDDFATIENEDFILRMDAKEADIFGDQAMALLQEAKAVICDKYDIELDHPIIVEIFPNQSDFGVRTFGMPHNPGFLGVCFGDVITANSPSSAIGRDSNWQAVLWHEFCHVVTLNLTKNKMPRWLSEGISVFEELERNPAWGQHMSPDYRQRVMRNEMTPIGELSGAFLNAESGEDMQFAYYQSSLVVEFIVEKYGMDALKNILTDLGAGIPINDAITDRTLDVEELDEAFIAWAQAKASKLGETLTWDVPDPNLISPAEMPDELPGNPTNYYLLIGTARQHIQNGKWDEAKEVLDTLLEAYPEQRGLDGALYLAAFVAGKQDDTDKEREYLEKLAAIDGDVSDAYMRLINIYGDAGDWESMKLNAERFLAVNPLSARPYEALAIASERLDDVSTAIKARQTLIKLNPLDPALAHFELARLLHLEGSDQAKRQVLLALEEAPRYQDAQRLLLSLVQPRPEEAPDSSPEKTEPKDSAPGQSGRIDTGASDPYGGTRSQNPTQASTQEEEQSEAPEGQ